MHGIKITNYIHQTPHSKIESRNMLINTTHLTNNTQANFRLKSVHKVDVYMHNAYPYLAV